MSDTTRRLARIPLLLAVSLAAIAAPEGGGAAVPKNFIFFERQRQRISELAFLGNEGIAGAQLKYTWRELEPERVRYELRPLLDDLAFLDRHGKRLFVQIQDVSFSEEILVPDYLCRDPAFGGGASRKYDFIKLLEVLGREVDGRIEGLNLPETSIGFGASGRLHPAGFTYASYVEAVKSIMSAARKAFPRSCLIQYANFMPGEWLPWSDRGYLRDVYKHAESIGVGVGGLDLLPHRKGQQNHSYPPSRHEAQGSLYPVRRRPGFGTRPTSSSRARWRRSRSTYVRQAIPRG